MPPISLPIHNPAPSVTRSDFVDRSAAATDERVLVVVFLRGGADGLTLVPPVGDDRYHRVRPSLGVKKADAIDLNGYFALNVALDPLHQHFKSGHLAVIHGAGSEDHTRSHFEAQDFMEHGGPAGGGGWLARYLRARDKAPSALGAVAIGTTQPESLRGAPVGAVMQTVRDFSFGDDDPTVIDQLARLYAVEAGPLGQAARDTIDAVKKLRLLRTQNAPPANGAQYPDSNFGRGLREIAKLIKADVGLVTTTIDLDGWDTHFVQGQLIGGLMRNLAAGLNALVTDLGEHMRRVTIVTMTEFGRRLNENTSFGTDHGAGSVMMLLGDGVSANGGGTVRSGWSDLSASNLDDVGDVPALINYRDALAPILLRHAPTVDLSKVFPGHRFADSMAAPRSAVSEARVRHHVRASTRSPMSRRQNAPSK
ncbi:MAG: DUF1501 domain-containing protein [Phycisphaerales bacterium]|nr:DUF1501 domain-containing protein [Phycisphaerales bacterium]MCI0674907.1 DUF1501 domain-containing protein [Phycisphaerales bacterium]